VPCAFLRAPLHQQFNSNYQVYSGWFGTALCAWCSQLKSGSGLRRELTSCNAGASNYELAAKTSPRAWPRVAGTVGLIDHLAQLLLRVSNIIAVQPIGETCNNSLIPGLRSAPSCSCLPLLAVAGASLTFALCALGQRLCRTRLPQPREQIPPASRYTVASIRRSQIRLPSDAAFVSKTNQLVPLSGRANNETGQVRIMTVRARCLRAVVSSYVDDSLPLAMYSRLAAVARAGACANNTASAVTLSALPMKRRQTTRLACAAQRHHGSTGAVKRLFPRSRDYPAGGLVRARR
jgi:hypothetical protein